MTYCVIDLETSVKESYKRTANPFDSDNNIIISALKTAGREPRLGYSPNGISRWDALPDVVSDSVTLLVGQNIKFDLLYLWESTSLQEFFQKGGKIWDTMLAEYLLTAQQSTYASLDKLAMKYGGTLKDDQIKKMWEVGLDTTEIDPEILLPYAEQDVINTEIVYLKQVEEAKRLGMLPLIEGYMDHLLALTEMEYNGLHVDMKEAQKLEERLTHELVDLRNRLNDIVHSQASDWPHVFEPGSPEHVSAILFNTPIRYTESVPQVNEDGTPKVYGPKAQKAGEQVYRNEDKEYIPSGFGLSTVGVAKYKKGGVYTADEKTLSQLRDKAPEFIDLLLKYRETKKLLTTYIYGEERGSGLIPLVQSDGCIHHTLDCVQTKTGRANSSRPNLQNVPPEVRKIFTSRFGENGRILEFDYCLAPHTKVLTEEFIWKEIKDIRVGETLIGFPEQDRIHDAATFQPSSVEKTKRLRKDCLEILTTEGVVRCSKDHMWKVSTGTSPLMWKRSDELQVGWNFSKVMEVWDTPQSIEAGWMAGFLDGEGYLSNGSQIGVGQNADGDNKVCYEKALKMFDQYLVNTENRINKSRRCYKIRPAGLRTGWQAVGVFQPDRLKAKLKRSYMNTSIRSKRNRKVEILEIRDIGIQEVVAIQTSTKTFLAEGFLSHNCQLEVCVQAYLSQSANMIQDIKDGVDFHAKRLGYAESLGYNEVVAKIQEDTTGTWSAKRKAAKTVSFQKAYGAHPQKIAQETHLSVEAVELIFAKEDEDYPEVKLFNEGVEASARKSRIPTKYLLSIRDKETGSYSERLGEYQGVGFYQSITGKRYHFLEKGSTSAKLRARPGADPYRYFSSPEIANYPVQGCLHGDTPIMTKEGLFPIKALAYQDIEVWSEGGWSKANCVTAGKKKQIKITFVDGREIICSPEHKFLTVIPEDLREIWRDAKELLQDNKEGFRRTVKLGPEVDFVGNVVFPGYSSQTQIGNGFKNISWNDISDKKTLGELLGRLASDGSVRPNKSVVWFFAEHEREVEETLVPVIQKLGHTSVRSKTNHIQEVRSYMISSTQLAYQSKGLKYGMPAYLFQDKELLRGYLRGMFDGDGTVDKYGTAKLAFGKQGYKLAWAHQIQLALTLFGIRSRVRHYPGVRTGVHIMKADAPLFAERIGFINSKKQERLKNGGTKRKSHYFSYIRTVEELPGTIEMYDIVNSANKVYCANGLITHNTAADIVALSVGRVWRYLKSSFTTVGERTDEIRMINEVHDSLVLDIGWFPESEQVSVLITTIQQILEDVAGTFKEKLGIGFNVPIKVDTKIGKSWGGDNDD